MKNQYNTNYTKLQSNNDRITRIAWRFSLAARKFMTEPRIWVKLMCRLAGMND